MLAKNIIKYQPTFQRMLEGFRLVLGVLHYSREGASTHALPGRLTKVIDVHIARHSILRSNL